VAILLLCRGDESARDLLRQSIMAHYGPNPVGYEAVRMLAVGRVRQQISRINLWLNLSLDTQFLFPHQFRQDYSIRLWKIPVLNKSEAYDGLQHYQKDRDKPAVTTPSDAPYIKLVQLRLRAFSSMLLLPLNEMHIQLTHVDTHTIIAQDSTTQTEARMTFYDNHQLQQVVTTIDGSPTQFRVNLSADVTSMGSVNAFRRIGVWWDDVFKYELYPTQIEFIDKLPEDTIQLT